MHRRSKMIRFKFDEKKTTQAAAFLIKKQGGSLNYTKLIKLLYLADREAFKSWERPISGDSYVSMPKGPVLSETYDLINYPNSSFWHLHISKKNYDVVVTKDPRTTSLTKNEVKILESIFELYKDKDWKQMIDICHACCEEWEHLGNTSIPIQVEDILKALHKTSREIEIIDDEIATLNYAKHLLQVA